MMASSIKLAQAPRQQRLARSVLVAAAVLAVVSFPFGATWWGGWILAVAEAGIVGGLADWFAVTAIFRRPMGLPIPHTALIPTNWEIMAARVGTMVGDRVLTTTFVTREIERLDIAGLITRVAERLTRGDLEAVTRTLGRGLTDDTTDEAIADLVARVRAFVAGRRLAPVLASVLETGRDQGWHERVVGELMRVLAEVLEHSRVRAVMAELVDEVLGRYRRRMALYPSFLITLADVVGLIDRDRLTFALHAALTRFIEEPGDPFRRQIADLVIGLPERLRTDVDLAARVEATLRDLLDSKVVGDLLHDAARELRGALVADLRRPRSEAAAWVADRLDAARQTLLTDPALRADLDKRIKSAVIEMVERYQDRIAGFIEKGVQALGPEGAVRLVEEHAGDDLQYIRVNGTVVGGLAGGAIYAIHLLARAL
jgi:uncharacterized membrane-anchored protein YjiN (DUF445 family)